MICSVNNFSRAILSSILKLTRLPSCACGNPELESILQRLPQCGWTPEGHRLSTSHHTKIMRSANRLKTSSDFAYCDVGLVVDDHAVDKAFGVASKAVPGQPEVNARAIHCNTTTALTTLNIGGVWLPARNTVQRARLTSDANPRWI